MSEQGNEWIYRYIFKTKYFRIAMVKKQFRNIQKLHKRPLMLMETSVNGYEWRVRKLI